MANEKQLDLIDRLKLLDSLGYDPMKFWAINPESTFGIVLNAPAVDAVEVVHGQWTRKPIGKYTGADEVCCSICGYFIGVVASDTGFREAIEGMNYCPNCGARMDMED